MPKQEDTHYKAKEQRGLPSFQVVSALEQENVVRKVSWPRGYESPVTFFNDSAKAVVVRFTHTDGDHARLFVRKVGASAYHALPLEEGESHLSAAVSLRGPWVVYSVLRQSNGEGRDGFAVVVWDLDRDEATTILELDTLQNIFPSKEEVLGVVRIIGVSAADFDCILLTEEAVAEHSFQTKAWAVRITTDGQSLRVLGELAVEESLVSD